MVGLVWELSLERIGEIAVVAVAFGEFALDGAESSLILADIVLEGTEKVLGVFGGHDNAALHAC